MEKHTRFFKLDTQWTALHLPNKPNGFGIFIIGDKHHFVSENTSFWMQHTGRKQMISQLLNDGYTVFYSNLYGENWGSPKAVTLAKLICHMIFKNETLNDRFHIIAEGMGALVALQLISLMEDRFRSVVFINPCVNIEAHCMKEKESKLFYKRFIKEVSLAYEIEMEQVEEMLLSVSFSKYFLSKIPIKIWQTTGNTPYSFNEHAKVFQEIRKNANLPVSIVFHLPEKIFSVSKFLSENEVIL